MAMHVSGISQQGAVPVAVKPQAASAAAREATDVPEQDKVTLGEQQTEPLTYGDPRKNKVGQSDLAQMLEESDRKAQAIIDLIRPLVEQQGLNLARVASGEQHLSADPASIEKAKAAIADGGEFSVEKTAERILSFAKAAIGDDPSRLGAIRAAVEKGFDEAQRLLGGSLPEISQKTHAMIQGEFDRWEKEGIPAGDKVSLAAPSNKAAAA